MRTIIYYTAAGLLYVVAMTLLIRELRDILLHPEKHNDIPGWSRYRHSFWFEHRSEYRHPWSKHYWAGIIFDIPFFIGGCFVLYFAGAWLQKVLFIPQGVMQLRTDGVMLGVLAGVFWVICLGAWLAYHSSGPVAIALSQHMFGGSRRTQKWKASIGMVLATAVFIPVMALGIESYAYATAEGFIVNRYFSMAETAAAYGECTAETTWRFNRGQDECYFSYTVGLPDGTDVELVQACSEEWERLGKLHARLAASGVELQRSTIDAESWQIIQGIVDAEDLAHIETYFIIE